MLHQKIHRITTLTAPKTFKDPFGWRYGERRGLFIMERTEAEEINPSSFKADKIPDHVGYLCNLENSLDSGVVDHDGEDKTLIRMDYFCRIGAGGTPGMNADG